MRPVSIVLALGCCFFLGLISEAYLHPQFQQRTRTVRQTPDEQDMDDTDEDCDEATLIRNEEPVMKGRSQRRGSNSDFIYPENLTNRNTETCVHGLCAHVKNYPKTRIINLLNRSKVSPEFFVDIQLDVTVATRFQTPDEMTMCETQQHSIYPEKAKNLNNIERTIVNVEGHKQGIVFETCLSNDRPCKFSETFPSGYSTSCKQKHVTRRLMIMNNDEKFVFDTFQIPSCCVCVVKKN